MTDHEQGLCPRCGKPAGDFGFCEACRSHIESLTWMPIREVMEAVDATDPATRARQAVRRLELALAAVSTAAVGQTSSSVQIDSGPRAEGATGDTSVEAVQPARPVARFEDVMRIAPSPAPIAQPPVDLSPAPIGEVRPILEQVPAVAPVVEEVVAPLPQPEPAARPEPAAEPDPAVEPEPVPEPLPAAASVPPPAPAPFWFECLPTAAPDAVEAPQASVPEPDRELRSIAPPGFHAEREDFVEDVVSPGTDNARRTWLVALCLLLLAGVVVVLTGRAPRR